jgi:hypothetical protein
VPTSYPPPPPPTNPPPPTTYPLAADERPDDSPPMAGLALGVALVGAVAFAWHNRGRR